MVSHMNQSFLGLGHNLPQLAIGKMVGYPVKMTESRTKSSRKYVAGSNALEGCTNELVVRWRSSIILWEKNHDVGMGSWPFASHHILGSQKRICIALETSADTI